MDEKKTEPKYRGGAVPDQIGDLILGMADLSLKSGGLSVKPGVDMVIGWLGEKPAPPAPAMKVPHPRPPATVDEKNHEKT